MIYDGVDWVIKNWGLPVAFALFVLWLLAIGYHYIT